jgi:hypothetical protein
MSALVPVATVDQVAELLRALATLLWPLVVVAFFLIFREPIRELLRRLTRARVLGQEAEFGRELDHLTEQASEAEAKTPDLVPKPKTDERRSVDLEIAELLREAATSPKVALMALSADLEARTRRLSAATGWARDERTVRRMLRRFPGIPDVLGDAVDEFWRVRNRIVHGQSASDDEILRALDAGISIVRALDRIPIERAYVEVPHTPLFADPQGLTPRHGVHGVILRIASPGGHAERFQVFPTTRDNFVRGTQVSWDWNLNHQWDRTWYRDPQSEELRHAFDSSAEFVGRDLAEI